MLPNIMTSELVNITVHRTHISSYYYTWASVSNAPNVLQPYWLILISLDVPALTTSLLLWGPSVQRWRYLWTFLFSNVPTSSDFSSQRGEKMADEFCLKIPDFHVIFRDLLHAVNLRHGTDSFTSPPKKGVLRNFSPWKIQRIRWALNPRTLGTKSQHATARPPKPLTQTHTYWIARKNVLEYSLLFLHV